MIDKSSPIPAYYQIYKYIIDKVDLGEWKPDSQIPSEVELADLFNVSRMTLRQALNMLKQEGVIISKQGIGSFVSGKKITQSLKSLTGFSQDMKERGFNPTSRVMVNELIVPEPSISEKLNIPIGEKIVKLKRLRFAGNVPMSIEIAHLDAAKFSGLLNYDLSQSLYHILKTEFGVVLHNAKQQLQIGFPNEEQASLLEIVESVPIMKMQRITFDQFENPIEFVTSIYRGDLYVFDVELVVEG